jgi:F-box interacting protein
MYTFDPATMNFRSVELVFSSRFEMSGPCNGLLCAYDIYGDAEVLNPTTRKHLRLPDSILKSRSLYSEYFVGFVHSTNQYKVVNVSHRVFLTYAICTIGAGALSWRILHESAELLKATEAVIFNDGMYWLLLNEASSYFSREILTTCQMKGSKKLPSQIL